MIYYLLLTLVFIYTGLGMSFMVDYYHKKMKNAKSTQEYKDEKLWYYLAFIGWIVISFFVVYLYTIPPPSFDLF